MADYNSSYTGAQVDAAIALAQTAQQPPSEGAFVDGDKTNLDAIKAKSDFISVTQPVDLDQMETDIAALANGMVYKGNWDASAGSFPSGADTGAFYTVSVAGTVDSVDFAVGDRLVATTDSASTTTYASNWSKLDATDAVQSVAGLVGTIAASSLRTALNVEDGATADQSNAEIETAYNAQVSIVSQAEAEAGSATTVRRWTAQRVAQAIAALAPSGSGGDVDGGSASSAGDSIQWRRDTAANWTSNNPTLADGEAGYETDTGFIKVGDGSTAWTSLGYTLSGLADPGADRIVFWDDSAGAQAYLTAGTGLSISGTTMTVTGLTVSEIAAGSLTGSDTDLVTGTAGTSGNLVSWDANGDAVDSSIAASDVAVQAVTENAQTGTTYTLVLGDASKLVSMSNASANTLTIPTNASVAFPVGTTIVVMMKGAGTTTITGATGVTVNGVSAGSGDISAQWGAVSLYKSATDTWYAMGSIGTVS